MTSSPIRPFALPARLHAKAAASLVAADERHLLAIADSIEHTLAELTARLDEARRSPAGHGQAALDRDQEVRRLAARLRTLRRYGMDLCLGRMVPADGSAPTYVGRLGLRDRDGASLLVDWRTPAAEPFFGATHARPMGLAGRRRYRWSEGRIVDYSDEVFVPDLAAALSSPETVDEPSAFIAGLGASRSTRMRDVLGTIQADQDAIIRADSRGVLVVDGGPGTGKTVVALHRAAYLLHADPRLGTGRGGVLLVGPHQPYLDYVADVLPGLGEDGVRTATLADLVPEGVDAAEEADPEVARLKADAAMVGAIEPAVRLYEEPPTEPTLVETPWADLVLGPGDWAEAFAAPEPGTPHNEAREQVWEALLARLVEQHQELSGGTSYDADGHDVEPDVSAADLRRALARNSTLLRTFDRAWPLLEPTDIVGDLWDVPAYLRHCAPWLAPEDVRRLRRSEPQAWTTADLPLLDAARRRVGDPETVRRRRRARAEVAGQRREMADVVDHLVASDDSEMKVMSMLRVSDAQSVIVDEAAVAGEGADPLTGPLAGPFAHVVVDEAQELTDAQWQMLLARCPSRSLTVVGDRAQARHGFAESWAERLARVGLVRVAQAAGNGGEDVRVASLSINYRTPAEVMAAAEPVIRAVLPDANVPTSVRSSGLPVRHAAPGERDAVLRAWLAEHEEGTACVIGDPAFVGTDRVRSLSPVLAKGLEFDLVVLVDAPRSDGPAGRHADADADRVRWAVDRYVAMTRATQQLVVLG